jgi:type IV pilus assembly protein PilC
MFYSYTAISPQGHRVKGMAQVHSRQHLGEFLLKSEQLQLLSARCAWEVSLLQTFQKTPWLWMQHFFFQMSCLLGAGVTIPKTLKILKEMELSRYRRWMIDDILYQVERGKRLSEILIMQTHIFPSLVGPMVRVGEVSSRLGEVFDGLSTYAGWCYENQQKMRQTMRYPLMVLCLVMGLIFFLMTFVLPSFISFLETSGEREHVESMVAVSQFFKLWVPWLLGSSLMVVTLFFFAAKINPKIKDDIQLFLWRWTPFYRHLIPAVVRMRFFYALSLLVNGGIPFLEALSLASKATQKSFFKRQVELLLQKVRAGTAFEKALFQDKVLLTAMQRHLLCVAERSGEMSNILKELHRLSQDEAMRKISSITGCLAPSLLLVLGGIMGWVAWSVFQPIYNQLGTIGGGI